jgi:hypothetical protein
VRSHVDFYMSREARVFAEISANKTTRQSCEVSLSCESWAFSEIISTWTVTFEGDHPQVFGTDNVTEANQPITVVLKNGIRSSHRAACVIEKKNMTAVCPLTRCSTRIVLEVNVKTRKGLFPSEPKLLSLF